MTKAQIETIRSEFFDKFTVLWETNDGREGYDRDISDEVWQFIESKLKAVEGEAVDDFANALAIEMTKPSVLAGGLEGMYRLFADFVMVFSRDYLKSNKLENKDGNNNIKTIS